MGTTLKFCMVSYFGATDKQHTKGVIEGATPPICGNEPRGKLCS